jgi:hypothetical protein
LVTYRIQAILEKKQDWSRNIIRIFFAGMWAQVAMDAGFGKDAR